MSTATTAPPLITVESILRSIKLDTMPESSISPTDDAIFANLAGGPHRIVLTGFMGAGKTTVGHKLAAALGWDFVDLDTLIEQRSGLTVPQIFAEQGEKSFRHIESYALAVTLRRSRIVLALGGGALELLTNRLLIEQKPDTLTVYLHAPLDVLTARCSAQEGGSARPVLADPDEANRRFALRLPHYQRLAGERGTVDTTAKDSTDVVVEIKAIIKSYKAAN